MPEPLYYEQEPRPGRGLSALFDLLRRRKWLGLLTFAALFTLATGIVRFLPNIYKSSATVLVERQQIPDEFVKSTVTGALDTRLQTISQEILSRSRLESLIQRFGLYPDMRGKAAMESIVERMRKDIKLELKGQEQRRGNRTTVAFSLNYTGPDPQRVANVANTLASFYIEENLKVREKQAAGTSDFLDAQLLDMRKQLEEQEKQVGKFKEKHIGELPQQMEANLATLERLNAQLRANADNQVKVQERRSALAAQLAEAESAAVPTGPNATATRLEQLRKQLAELQTRYSDKYPDVMRVRAEIALLEDELRKGPAGGAAALAPTSPQILQLRQSIRDADLEYKGLRAEADTLRQSIAEYQRRVDNAPRREQEYQSLARDYETTQQLYRSLLTRQREAEVGESMEQRQKGESFRIIEPAVASEDPTAPKRPMLLAAGLFLALILGAGAILLAEQLDDSFHHLDDLKAAAAVPVLVSIPRIVTRRDIIRRRLRFGLGAVTAGLGLTVLMGSAYFIARSDFLLALVTQMAS